jgi:hypothetical protein
MRLSSAARGVALAIASGACGSLSGLSEYRECPNDCSEIDANTFDGPRSTTADGSPSDSEEEEGEGQNIDAAYPPDSTSGDEEPVDAWTADAATDAETGAGDDSATDAATGAAADAATDGAVDAGVPPSTGATCGPKGTAVRCNASQICCGDLSAETNSCTAPSGCSSNASLSCAKASDCPGAAPICCAHVTLSGGTAPACTASAYYASCAATCKDNPPANGCTFNGIVRLCSSDSDCQSDTANPLGLGAANECWNYNNTPESFCTSAVVGQNSGGVHQ